MKTIKPILFASLLTLLQFSAKSQIIPSIRVGMNIANQLETEKGRIHSINYTPRIGLIAGANVEIPFSRNFVFETGIAMSQKGYRVNAYEDETYIEVVDTVETVVVYEELNNRRLNLTYIEVPLTLKIKFWTKGGGDFYTILGPYVAYAISGRMKEKTELGSFDTSSFIGIGNSSKKVKFGSGKSQIKPLDYGLVFGAGFEKNHLQFSLSYVYGMANLSNITKNNYWYSNYSFNFSINYRFGDFNNYRFYKYKY